MGGDDLDDLDDAWIHPVRGGPDNDSEDEDQDDQDLDEQNDGSTAAATTPSNKRGADTTSTSTATSTEAHSLKRPRLSVLANATSKSKQQSSGSADGGVNTGTRLLVQAGINIQDQDATQCAAFLTTCIRHYTLLEQGHGVKNDLDNDNQDEDDKGDESKNLLKNLDLLPRYCLGRAATGSNTTTASLVDRLRDLVSIKKLKQWKMVASPCVIIVCLSARRAVAILKELSPLHVRSAKLFPKNGSLSEQHEQLATTSFGLAVATPHRLYQLLSSSSAAAMASTTASPTAPASKQGHGNKQSNKHQPQHIKHQQTKTRTRTLSLEHCKLLIFDCHVSNKQYTVCTLPDTAPHCAKLVRDYVLPMCVSSKHHSSIKTETAADSHCRIAFV